MAIVFALKKFRHYLIGRPVTVRTDHASLKWLMEFKDPEGQVARWLQIIGTYDLSRIIHRPGRIHGNADGLSRRPCKQCGMEEEEPGGDQKCRVTTRAMAGADRAREAPEEEALIGEGTPPEGPPENEEGPGSEEEGVSQGAMEGPTEETARTEEIEDELAVWPVWQEEDGIIKEVRRWYLEGEMPPALVIQAAGYEMKAWAAQMDRLAVVNDALGRWWVGPAGRTHFQVAVPAAHRDKVLHQVHGGAITGHLGRTRTIRRIQEGFYWPDFRRDATRWCARCEPCVRRKSAKPPHRAAMGHVPAGMPLQRVAMDIMGPLPVTEEVIFWW